MKAKTKKQIGQVGGGALVILVIALIVSVLTSDRGETWSEWFKAWTSFRSRDGGTPEGATPTWGEWAGDLYDRGSAWVGSFFAPSGAVGGVS